MEHDLFGQPIFSDLLNPNSFEKFFHQSFTDICLSFRLPENVFFWEISQRNTDENHLRLFIKEKPYPFSELIKSYHFPVLTITEKNLMTKIGYWEIEYEFNIEDDEFTPQKIEKISYSNSGQLNDFILHQANIALKNYKSQQPSFGCCSKYQDCANKEKCIHENLLYSTSCQYRKNLENNNNFYKQR